ncbi:MAG TPA: VTT domain-containing protein [Pirellulales bacterium]
MSSEQHPSGRARIAVKIGLGIILLAVVLILGRSLGHHIPQVEDWIAAQGLWGYVIFVAVMVGATSIFVPDTVFAIAAGALFGVLWGTLAMTVGCLLTAALNYATARLFLQNMVHAYLERKPQLAAIQRAVDREGFRFQLLLRLTPINPVSVSYILGAAGTRFSTFLAACLGLVPALFVEVYFGYVAKHVAKVSGGSSEHSKLHTAITIIGLLACVAMLIYVVRVARQAIRTAEAADNIQGPGNS